MDNCQPQNLLWRIEALKTQPQLRVEKERLEIWMVDLSAELAVKSKEARQFHTNQE